MLKPLTKLTHGLGIDAVARSLTIDFSSDQAGVFQDFQMLGNGCLGQWHDIDNLTTNAGTALCEHLQNFQPGWMRKRLASEGKGFEI